MSRFAITDIHGCSQTFEALLDLIKLDRNDELYLLGDYVDRGPDSVGVIDRIVRMQADGYRVRCLMGNHEEMALERYQRAAHKLHAYRDEHFRWMMQLEDHIEIPGYLLVHAGLNFQADDPLADVNSLRWIRYWEEDLDRDWLGDRKVIYGHTPRSYVEVANEVAKLDEVPMACIDAGCAFQARGLGYLVALDLDEQRIYQMRRIEPV